MEKWKPIMGYEGKYEVSSHGNIRSLSRRTLLKSGKERRVNSRTMRLKNVNGYRSVALYKYGTRNEQYVHRLVAFAFIQKTEGKNYINHKDGNPSNNNTSNLEWVTHSENVNHAYQKGLNSNKGCQHKNARQVYDSELKLSFPTIKDWAETRNINYSTAINVLNGQASKLIVTQYIENEMEE